MRCIVHGQGAPEKTIFTVSQFYSSGTSLTLQVPQEARGKRALVLTYWTGSNSQCVFTLYVLTPEGTLQRVCGWGEDDYTQLVPTYNESTYTLFAARSNSWKCAAQLLY